MPVTSALFTGACSGASHVFNRINHRRFRRLRVSFLIRHPVCVHCHAAPASILDHVIPHRGNAALFWDETNWQALCVVCHGVKTARETWSVPDE